MSLSTTEAYVYRITSYFEVYIRSVVSFFGTANNINIRHA